MSPRTAPLRSEELVFVGGFGEGATLPYNDTWRIDLEEEITDNDQSKDFTVPASQEWQVLSVWVQLVTLSGATNRQLVVEAITVEGNIFSEVRAGVVQPANNTYFFQFAPGLPQDIAVRDTNYVAVAMMPLFLSAGQKLRVREKSGANSGDDMRVRVQVATRSV